MYTNLNWNEMIETNDKTNYLIWNDMHAHAQ